MNNVNEEQYYTKISSILEKTNLENERLRLNTEKSKNNREKDAVDWINLNRQISLNMYMI